MLRRQFALVPVVVLGCILVWVTPQAPAADEAVIEEIKGALAALALHDNKPEPALVKALEEKNSLRRVAAVEALCQTGREEVAELTRKLLEDKNKVVQLRAALALANFK